MKVPRSAPTKPTAMDTKNPPPVPPPIDRPIAPQIPATTSSTSNPVIVIVMRRGHRKTHADCASTLLPAFHALFGSAEARASLQIGHWGNLAARRLTDPNKASQ